MMEGPALQRGRATFDQKAWAESYRLLQAAEREAPLEPEDLDRLATAAYLIGRDDESEASRTRAHRLFLERHDCERAARSAFWLGFGLVQRGATAPASGWFARAERILEDAGLDSVVRGYLLIPYAIQQIVRGDPASGDTTFSRAAEFARRFGDRDLAAVACAGRGRALIRRGRITEGVALLDEAMVAVVADEVTPVVAGDVYCSVLEGCQEIFDVRRSYEWTTLLARWCSAQADLVRYRGDCLLYRAEVRQFRGSWTDAGRDAQEACALLRSRPAEGGAFYRVGEIHRLRGEFTRADAAYSRANECGRKPQPGLSLLRLAQGQIDVAATSIRTVLADMHAPAARTRMLPAAVEILLAAGDLDTARAAAAELSAIAETVGTPFLSAMSAHASGAVLIVDDDSRAASLLSAACAIWRDLAMPYEEAQTRRLLAVVYERRGDQEQRRLELEAVRKLLERLDAPACLASIEEAGGPAPHQPAGSLSERELQVLRLLAAGKTNRAIAEELFISEKTVARHVSNILDKVGASSRTAATAWAFQHKLI